MASSTTVSSASARATAAARDSRAITNGTPKDAHPFYPQRGITGKYGSPLYRFTENELSVTWRTAADIHPGHSQPYPQGNPRPRAPPCLRERHADSMPEPSQGSSRIISMEFITAFGAGYTSVNQHLITPIQKILLTRSAVADIIREKAAWKTSDRSSPGPCPAASRSSWPQGPSCGLPKLSSGGLS